MQRVLGFALFFMGIGIAIGCFLPGRWCETFSVLACWIIGYWLFFHC